MTGAALALTWGALAPVWTWAAAGAALIAPDPGPVPAAPTIDPVSGLPYSTRSPLAEYAAARKSRARGRQR